MDIVHTIKHRLRLTSSEKAGWNLQATYEPEYTTVELAGPGGKVNFDVALVEDVQALLDRVIEIRDRLATESDDDISQ